MKRMGIAISEDETHTPEVRNQHVCTTRVMQRCSSSDNMRLGKR
jgi:hypothetical protein